MIAIVTLLAPLFAQVPLPSIPPPPPPPADALPEAQRQRFVSFVAGPVTCGGAGVAPVTVEQPMSSTHFAFRTGDIGTAPIVLRFTIDATGRPIDIALSDGDRPGGIDYSDVMPAFATWRFTSGTPRQGCTVAFAVDDRPVTAASPVAAMRYLALEGGDRPLFERTIPPGSTCFAPNAPPELVRVWPDFDTIPQRPGSRSFTMTGFDIDRSGKPINVHVLTSDGNRDLDAKSVASVRRSRFVKGARAGCTYPFRRTPNEPLLAPEGPKAIAFRAPGAQCEGAGDWTHLGLLTFPEPFRKRAIEGWAIVRFDVAPWGETGDFTVLKAEPAALFGTQAIETIRQSTKAPSSRGYTGCVEKVVFKMDKPNGDAGG